MLRSATWNGNFSRRVANPLILQIGSVLKIIAIRYNLLNRFQRADACLACSRLPAKKGFESCAIPAMDIDIYMYKYSLENVTISREMIPFSVWKIQLETT